MMRKLMTMNKTLHRRDNTAKLCVLRKEEDYANAFSGGFESQKTYYSSKKQH